MVHRQLAHILCLILIVNFTIRNAGAISFDDIIEYFFDDSDESSDELVNSNLNVTCKNCNLSIECRNCTPSHKPVQSTAPVQISTPQFTSPTPTIPAPEQVVEIVSSHNVPSESIATASQSDPTTISTPVTNAKPSTNTKPETSPSQPSDTKSIGDENKVTDDGANLTTDTLSDSSDSVTSGNEPTT